MNSGSSFYSSLMGTTSSAEESEAEEHQSDADSFAFKNDSLSDTGSRLRRMASDSSTSSWRTSDGSNEDDVLSNLSCTSYYTTRLNDNNESFHRDRPILIEDKKSVNKPSALSLSDLLRVATQTIMKDTEIRKSRQKVSKTSSRSRVKNSQRNVCTSAKTCKSDHIKRKPVDATANLFRTSGGVEHWTKANPDLYEKESSLTNVSWCSKLDASDQQVTEYLAAVAQLAKLAVDPDVSYAEQYQQPVRCSRRLLEVAQQAKLAQEDPELLQVTSKRVIPPSNSQIKTGLDISLYQTKSRPKDFLDRQNQLVSQLSMNSHKPRFRKATRSIDTGSYSSSDGDGDDDSENSDAISNLKFLEHVLAPVRAPIHTPSDILAGAAVLQKSQNVIPEDAYDFIEDLNKLKLTDSYMKQSTPINRPKLAHKEKGLGDYFPRNAKRNRKKYVISADKVSESNKLTKYMQIAKEQQKQLQHAKLQLEYYQQLTEQQTTRSKQRNKKKEEHTETSQSFSTNSAEEMFVENKKTNSGDLKQNHLAIAAKAKENVNDDAVPACSEKQKPQGNRVCFEKLPVIGTKVNHSTTESITGPKIVVLPPVSGEVAPPAYHNPATITPSPLLQQSLANYPYELLKRRTVRKRSRSRSRRRGRRRRRRRRRRRFRVRQIRRSRTPTPSPSLSLSQGLRSPSADYGSRVETSWYGLTPNTAFVDTVIPRRHRSGSRSRRSSRSRRRRKRRRRGRRRRSYSRRSSSRRQRSSSSRRRRSRSSSHSRRRKRRGRARRSRKRSSFMSSTMRSWNNIAGQIVDQLSELRKSREARQRPPKPKKQKPQNGASPSFRSFAYIGPSSRVKPAPSLRIPASVWNRRRRRSKSRRKKFHELSDSEWD